MSLQATNCSADGTRRKTIRGTAKVTINKAEATSKKKHPADPSLDAVRGTAYEHVPAAGAEGTSEKKGPAPSVDAARSPAYAIAAGTAGTSENKGSDASLHAVRGITNAPASGADGIFIFEKNRPTDLSLDAGPKPTMSSPPSTLIHDITSSDVLSGRGAAVNAHDGNAYFRSLCVERKSTFDDGSSARKRHVATEIVDGVLSLDPPGRFLKSVAVAKGSTGGKQKVGGSIGGPWIELPREKSIEKAMKVMWQCKRFAICTAEAGAEGSIETTYTCKGPAGPSLDTPPTSTSAPSDGGEFVTSTSEKNGPAEPSSDAAHGSDNAAAVKGNVSEDPKRLADAVEAEAAGAEGTIETKGSAGPSLAAPSASTSAPSGGGQVTSEKKRPADAARGSDDAAAVKEKVSKDQNLADAVAEAVAEVFREHKKRPVEPSLDTKRQKVAKGHSSSTPNTSRPKLISASTRGEASGEIVSPSIDHDDAPAPTSLPPNSPKSTTTARTSSVAQTVVSPRDQPIGSNSRNSRRHRQPSAKMIASRAWKAKEAQQQQRANAPFTGSNRRTTCTSSTSTTTRPRSSTGSTSTPTPSIADSAPQRAPEGVITLPPPTPEEATTCTVGVSKKVPAVSVPTAARAGQSEKNSTSSAASTSAHTSNDYNDALLLASTAAVQTSHIKLESPGSAVSKSVHDEETDEEAGTRAELKLAKEEVVKMRKEIRSLREDQSRSEKELTTLREAKDKEISSLQQGLTKSYNSNSTLQKEKVISDETVKTLRQDLCSWKAANESLQKKLNESDKKVSSLEEKLKAVDNEHKKKVSSLN